MVGASSSLGRYYAASSEVARTGRGGHRWPAVVLPRQQSTVLACDVLMLELRRDRSPMRLVSVGFLSRRRAGGYSALSAVECDVGIIVHNDSLVVDTRHVRDIHIGDRAVVEE